MNNQSPDQDNPVFIPKILWLVLALCPAVPIAFGTAKELPDSTMQVIGFVINPALTIFCSYCLLRRDSGISAARVLGSILLGGFFAVFNMLGGMFAGCAMGGFKI